MTTAPACLVYLVLAWSSAEARFLGVLWGLDQLDHKTNSKRLRVVCARVIAAIRQPKSRLRASRKDGWSSWSIGLCLIMRGFLGVSLDQPRPKNRRLDQLHLLGACV